MVRPPPIPAVLGLGAQVGIRQRSVLVAVVVVLIALLVGGSGLLFLLQQNLDRSAQATADARATEVADLVRTDGLRDAASTLSEESRSGQFVQIVDDAGLVVGSSSQLVAGQPMSTQRPRAGETLTRELDLDGLGVGGDWLVVAQGVSAAAQVYVVQVAIPTGVQRETVQTVAIFLLAATPLLLIFVAAAVWFLVGRALRAVEQIRGEVATIDARRLASRVQVPATRDELAALATTMNSMLDKLETSHRSQRTFVSDASHELRSPLATLTTATELAVRSDEITRTRLLGTICDELLRMRILVDNLMTLARADAQGLVDRREDVDLDDLVDAEVQRLRATSLHTVIVHLDPARVQGDPQQLTQALRNLVDNAARHAHSHIRLTLTAAEGMATVWVDNDGEIIAPQDRERIFERFVRLDQSRTRDEGGSGLGLAISRSTAESHGGTLDVGDAPDGWCRFQLTVPAE